VFPVGSWIVLTDAFGTIPAGGRVQVTGHVSALTITISNADDAGNVGAVANIMSRADISSKASRRLDNVEIIWVPPLSIFEIDHGIPGSCSLEMTLNPETSNTYQTACLESKSAAKTAGATASTYKVSIVNLYFYTNIVNGDRISNMTYMLDLDQIRCQTSLVTGAGPTQHPFHVSSSTRALTLAFQDSRTSSDTRASASRFKAYNTAYTADQETLLNRFYVNYSSNNYPSPDAEPLFVDGTGLALATLSSDYLTNRFVDSNIYSGMYYSDGGTESIDEFLERGMYNHMITPRDADDNSNRVIVNVGFSAAPDHLNVLLFDHSRQVAKITMVEGRVSDVILEDV
jgi:hypothetical protein